MPGPRLRVLFAAAEAYPFAKAGGLGDVAGALPRALAGRGHEVRLILPNHPQVGAGDPAGTLAVELGGSVHRVRILRHGSHGGITVYSVDSPEHFDRHRIYGYPDDDARFILFSKSVAAVASSTGWVPHVVHVNDWHLGLVPHLLAEAPGTRTVLTIHNLGLQGPLSRDQDALIGPSHPFDGGLLARGIAFADRVNTVSGRYLQEILTPGHGMGLDRLLRSRDVTAIRNGVDGEEFDPRRDPRIASRYDRRSLGRKAGNKAALQRGSALAVDPDAPVVGVVTRLAEQKGVDLVLGALDELVSLGMQVVVAGVGEGRYRRALEEAAGRHRGAVAYHPADGETVARRVYAGADLFLAPSSYEPCGLAPLVALRYGTIPVVRHTGGLAETITDVSRHPRRGVGFGFAARRSDEVVAAARRALALRARPGRWEELQRRAMSASFSWGDAARAYERLYLDALAHPGRRPPEADRDARAPRRRSAGRPRSSTPPAGPPSATAFAASPPASP